MMYKLLCNIVGILQLSTKKAYDLHHNMVINNIISKSHDTSRTKKLVNKYNKVNRYENHIITVTGEAHTSLVFK